MIYHSHYYYDAKRRLDLLYSLASPLTLYNCYLNASISLKALTNVILKAYSFYSNSAYFDNYS